ncbi:MAG: hypothetical protein WBL21_09975, partial [Salinimicrobium sp.]
VLKRAVMLFISTRSRDHEKETKSGKVIIAYLLFPASILDQPSRTSPVAESITRPSIFCARA